ncbi:nuclear GTP-binding protein nug1 [Ophidiomyces ophidiicola]|nr:nuclear GTP-binding protein nug1 [Ophidiomyces ophidiicola]KAI1977293.1 nuclear GTP-binding protein nug1 [Ophidiomyces ophidiicola]KAI1980565.1 nuclear GTP-binding protein nug1 [Ophidiomyces ophidiicola]KAI1983586.1 nuclear GTP-binding protein nug1 [Ophidiomyces ophidiicola]
MVKLGKNSKRTPVRLRHKIEKASTAKQRKQRKLAKKNPQWRSRLKRDPGIPSLFPYKDRILNDIEERKRILVQENSQTHKPQYKCETSTQDFTTITDDQNVSQDVVIDDEMEDAETYENPMAALLTSARARAAEYSAQIDDQYSDFEEMNENEDLSLVGSVASGPKDTSRRAFNKIFKRVIETADVILYVLDARDPEGTRSTTVEREIMSANSGDKRLILIMNKIDLVPHAVLKGWLSYLRRYFPCLPLKASTGTVKPPGFDDKEFSMQATSETLLKALKSYAHNKQFKRSISVGVIGYPNVGKSSVINALASRLGRGASSPCPVGAAAGITTSLRELKLDNKIKLIDSPGIVFPNTRDAKDVNQEARLVLLNAIPLKQMSDPITAVSLLLDKLKLSQALLSSMLEFYGIPPLQHPANENVHEFLIQVARKKGRLGKGGVPNVKSAAMAVVTDWRDGRIQGWVEAPTQALVYRGAAAPLLGSDRTIIVSEWSKEFDLAELYC